MTEDIFLFSDRTASTLWPNLDTPSSHRVVVFAVMIGGSAVRRHTCDSAGILMKMQSRGFAPGSLR